MFQDLRECWNGRQARLRCVWFHRVGSSPISRTKKETPLGVSFLVHVGLEKSKCGAGERRQRGFAELILNLTSPSLAPFTAPNGVFFCADLNSNLMFANYHNIVIYSSLCDNYLEMR